MNKIIIILLSISLFLFFMAREVKAVQPVGFLDRADSEVIAGWAKDDDFNGPIPVHIYVDGQMVQGVTADGYRSDVGNHAFHWSHSSFGPGSHRVNVYAIGVNSSGQPDNNNPELSGSPKTITEQEEYPLTSSDGKVTVVVNAKFGGAITKIIDTQNFGSLNLINDSQAGAMFQSAFWLLPAHTQTPPGCLGGPDQWNENPTQAGYLSNGLAGNPIGFLGTDRTTTDPNEFIRFEDDGKTIHLKSRFIRYDYCENLADMQYRNAWDTHFYIEQWVSFYSNLPRTLKLRSKITYSNDGYGHAEIMGGGGMPGIYAFHLPRAAYYANEQKVIDNSTGFDHPLIPIPDKNWAAIIGSATEAGIGMVFAPQGRSDVDVGKFNFGIRGDSGVSSQTTSIFAPLGAGAVYDTIGKMINISVRNEPHPIVGTPMHHYTFNSTSSFEWYTYYPIGTLDMIKQNSEAILADYTAFGMTPPTPTFTPTPIPPTSTPIPPSPTPTPIPGDINHDNKVNIRDYSQLVTDFGKTGSPGFVVADINNDGKVDIFDYNILMGNFGK